MNSHKGIHGDTCQFENPEWKPLLDLASDHIDDFMWMCEIELEDGTRLHAYKHWWTRRYIHLTGDGRAFVYLWDESQCEDARYEEADPQEILALVLPDAEEADHIRSLSASSS